jgi:ribonuclease T1
MRRWRARWRLWGVLALGLWLGLAWVGAQAWNWGERRDHAEIPLAQLPPEARHTLVLIKRGGPFPYARDGSVFSNRERHLPMHPRGYYREYTVPTPGAHNRGARRIVSGSTGEYWYTADHYRSFRRIRE